MQGIQIAQSQWSTSTVWYKRCKERNALCCARTNPHYSSAKSANCTVEQKSWVVPLMLLSSICRPGTTRQNKILLEFFFCFWSHWWHKLGRPSKKHIQGYFNLRLSPCSTWIDTIVELFSLLGSSWLHRFFKLFVKINIQLILCFRINRGENCEGSSPYNVPLGFKVSTK